MGQLVRILQFRFLPASTDLALLALRLWVGLSMAILHGWGKFTGFSSMAAKFADPFGIGPTPSLALAVFGELVCSVLLVLGLFTRFAALSLVITMSVAFFLVHKASLQPGPGSGELAFLYLSAYVVLLIAGAGRFSLDARIGGASPS